MSREKRAIEAAIAALLHDGYHGSAVAILLAAAEGRFLCEVCWARSFLAPVDRDAHLLSDHGCFMERHG